MTVNAQTLNLVDRSVRSRLASTDCRAPTTGRGCIAIPIPKKTDATATHLNPKMPHRAWPLLRSARYKTHVDFPLLTPREWVVTSNELEALRIAATASRCGFHATAPVELYCCDRAGRSEAVIGGCWEEAQAMATLRRSAGCSAEALASCG